MSTVYRIIRKKKKKNHLLTLIKKSGTFPICYSSPSYPIVTILKLSPRSKHSDFCDDQTWLLYSFSAYVYIPRQHNLIYMLLILVYFFASASLTHLEKEMETHSSILA